MLLALQNMALLENRFCLLWDESHLWGVMLCRALEQFHIPFYVARSHDIRQGLLEKQPPAALLVPGGWARYKAGSLGSTGLKMIKDYVARGGRYLGFCGGAGLALKTGPGHQCLELCSWGRKTFRERLPNFSGHIRCALSPEIPWDLDSALLPVWWPSQFSPDPSDHRVTVLASYLSPGQDFWVSDLKLSSIRPQDIPDWEALYGVNLNPDMITHEPCLIKGSFGRGEYVLSYCHLETPNSPEANTILARILASWLDADSRPDTHSCPAWNLQDPVCAWTSNALVLARQSLDRIIDQGMGQFLFFWRKSWLLGWKRGIPGSPVNFLYALVCQAMHADPGPKARLEWASREREFQHLMTMFVQELSLYLCRERLAITRSPSSPQSSSDADLSRQRQRLFGTFPGYGGIYARLLRELDTLVYAGYEQRFPR